MNETPMDADDIEPKGEWDWLRTEHSRLMSEGCLDLSDTDLETLRRVGRQVGLSANKVATLTNTEDGVAHLVHETQVRIKRGSRQLGEALISAHELVKNGKRDEARAVLMEVVRTAEVPFYARLASYRHANLGLEPA